ncbi:MAG: hypothetical protein BZY87_01955 [SAR202 cluster bacterium Io17-Chloro-G6]|nr:MAG: hypothetical protein BZY87_01955 [SAR202 cluster bacterium Io17-Chloro-G6]
MITRLYFENFRAFEKLEINLSQINLFFGPNNSGKSALLSALGLLSQTVDSIDPEIPFLLNGKYEELGTFEDLVFQNKVDKKIKIGLEVIGLKETVFRPSSSRSRGYQIVENDMPAAYMEVTLGYRKQRHEVTLEAMEFRSPSDQLLLRTRRVNRSGRQVVDSMDDSYSITPGEASRALDMHHFLPFIGVNVGNRSSRSNALSRRIRYLTMGINEILTNIEFVGPFRQYPQRTYLSSGESPSTVGKHGERAIDILVADSRRRGSKRLGIASAVSEWLLTAEIAREIEIKTLTDRHFEARMRHFATGESENLADIGFGCSQVLPLLVAGYNLGPGSTFVVQQPEIHLHPRAQAELGTFLCSLAQRGIQVFVETHSEHLLLRLQSHVAAGDLEAKISLSTMSIPKPVSVRPQLSYL